LHPKHSLILSGTFARAWPALLLVCLTAHAQTPTTAPTTAPSPPSTRTALAIPPEQQGFDPSQYLLGDPDGTRKQLFDRGIAFEPYLVLDISKVAFGGLNTRDASFRQRFNFPIELDMEKLAGIHGGNFTAIYQFQGGGNASHTQVGDAQNFSFATDADNRSQLGQLWYQQKFFNDTFRLRLGKLEGNADFDVLDNVQEFVNNSFQTSPTLGLLPSFPDTGMGIQLFYEPKSNFYAGAGLFDGSIAHGVRLGEYGLADFLDRADNLFLIGEIGQRYKLDVGTRHFPGKIALGGWCSTDPFTPLSGTGRVSGTGGAYALFDQLLWKPFRQQPVPAGPPGATPDFRPEEETYPGGIAMSSSISWADPLVNRIDGNALLGLSWVGSIPARPIDELGLGATWAHFSPGAAKREDFELSLETFYRVRFTQSLSLKPDLQYIFHPSGSGTFDEPTRHDTLVFDLRLELSF
jgi:porin